MLADCSERCESAEDLSDSSVSGRSLARRKICGERRGETHNSPSSVSSFFAFLGRRIVLAVPLRAIAGAGSGERCGEEDEAAGGGDVDLGF